MEQENETAFGIPGWRVTSRRELLATDLNSPKMVEWGVEDVLLALSVKITAPATVGLGPVGLAVKAAMWATLRARFIELKIAAISSMEKQVLDGTSENPEPPTGLLS